MKREFLMLAAVYDASRHYPMNWMISEKLDGVRCFWDGGISRGLPCSQVPFANVEKHDRFVNAPIATGLWTRYGQPIVAPDYWINDLPRVPLDGELTMGRGTFQDTVSCTRRHDPGVEWDSVRYAVFDIPAYSSVFADGRMTNTFFRRFFSGVVEWAETRNPGFATQDDFSTNRHRLTGLLQSTRRAYQHPQRELPIQFESMTDSINQFVDSIVIAGGEGAMLRSPRSFWKPERSKQLLKVKPFRDGVGVVVGYTWGKSGVGTKLVGLMGSLRVRAEGVEFDLSGFTDDERRMTNLLGGNARIVDQQGETINPQIYSNDLFPIGSSIRFEYREKTVDGSFKEARFKRSRI